MSRKLDLWTSALGSMLIVGALFACKKSEPPPPAATAAPVAEPVATASATSSASADKKGDVKRYADKEQAESGTVRVAIARLRVYNEADEGTAYVAELFRGTLVNRKARYGNWLLIDYPTGVGQLSPGWVMAVQTSTKVEKVDPTAVAQQDAGAVHLAVPDAGAVATATATTSAAPPTTASATATTTASAAPPATGTSTTPTPTATATTRKPRIIPPPPVKGPPKPG